MISDSPYQQRTLVLSPRAGIAAGIFGSGVMLVVILLLGPVSGLPLEKALLLMGGALGPRAGGSPGDAPFWGVGLGLHLALGALFGLLYALCQLRAPARGLIGVGLFYGFLLWIIGSLVLRLGFSGPLRAMGHSWVWLVACLVYGLVLALASLWAESRPSNKEPAGVPLD